MGKTVTTEFATRKPGPTTNPANPGHTPGGSSSGSAAGVAAGFFPLAYGTQTAGSVIRPAAYCGVVGYKPTFGTISRIGMKVMSDSLDTVGVMARSVADCALLAGAVSGRDLGDPDVRPDAAPRVGLCRSPSWDLAGPETAALLERVGCGAGAGRRGGVRPRAAGGVLGAGAGAPDRHEQRERPRAGLGTGDARATRSAPGCASGWNSAWGAARRSGRRRWGCSPSTQRAFPAAMEGLDVLVTPSAPGEAPAGLDWTGDPAFNFIWTSLHVPCVTVPAGSGPNGLPLGIQIVGRPARIGRCWPGRSGWPRRSSKAVRRRQPAFRDAVARRGPNPLIVVAGREVGYFPFVFPAFCYPGAVRRVAGPGRTSMRWAVAAVPLILSACSLPGHPIACALGHYIDRPDLVPSDCRPGTEGYKLYLAGEPSWPDHLPTPYPSHPAMTDSEYDANVARDAATAASRANFEKQQAIANAQAADDRAKLKAAEPPVFANYRNCVYGNAARLAVISNEPADTVVRAAYAACHSQRMVLTELHKRYGDPGFDDEMMDRIEAGASGAFVLTVIQARAAKATRSPGPAPAPPPALRDDFDLMRSALPA